MLPWRNSPASGAPPVAPVDEPRVPLARPYTAADDLALRDGAARGDTALVVAQQIGRTRNSVLGRAAKLGVRFAGGRT